MGLLVLVLPLPREGSKGVRHLGVVFSMGMGAPWPLVNEWAEVMAAGTLPDDVVFCGAFVFKKAKLRFDPVNAIVAVGITGNFFIGRPNLVVDQVEIEATVE